MKKKIQNSFLFFRSFHLTSLRYIVSIKGEYLPSALSVLGNSF